MYLDCHHTVQDVIELTSERQATSRAAARELSAWSLPSVLKRMSLDWDLLAWCTGKGFSCRVTFTWHWTTGSHVKTVGAGWEGSVPLAPVQSFSSPGSAVVFALINKVHHLWPLLEFLSSNLRLKKRHILTTQTKMYNRVSSRLDFPENWNWNCTG